MQIALDQGHTYDSQTDTLFSCSEGGLFSNFYHTLWSVIDLRNQGIIPAHINFSRGFALFREEWGDDLYPLFFAPPPPRPNSWSESPAARATPLPRLDHHGTYAVYPYPLLRAVRDTYFQPSATVIQRRDAMAARHGLIPGQYIALYHRGTDKGEEIRLTEAGPLLASVRAAMERSGIGTVLVQTDDSHLLDFYLRHLDAPVVLDELPTTGGTQGFHYLNHEQGLVSKQEFSLNLVAMTELLADSAQLVTTTSNLAGWACLRRGHADGVIQFNKHGRRVTRLYAQLFRVKNRLRRLRSRLQGSPVHYV